MDENTGQQPEQTEEAKKRQQRFAEQMAKKKELGLDPSMDMDIASSLAENVVNQKMADISKLIELKVAEMETRLAGKVEQNYSSLKADVAPVLSFVKQIQEQIPAGAQMQQPGSQMMVQQGGDIPAGPGLMQSGGMAGGKPDMFGLILQQVLPRLMGGTHTENTGMEQMIKAAQGYGEFVKAIMAPITEMQTTMRQSLLQEMQTYSKTGGQLPWDADAEAPPQRRQVAQLNQRHQLRQPEPEPVDDTPSDYSERGNELYKKFKFV